MRAQSIFLFLILISLFGCGTFFNESSQQVAYSDFSKLTVGTDTLETVKSKIGRSQKSFYLDDQHNIVDTANNEQWVYSNKGFDRLFLYFEQGLLKSKSWSFNGEIPLLKLLEDHQSNWKIIKEPMSNPHAAPSDCYLEDLDGGRLIKLSAYDKKPDYFSVWAPSKKQTSIKEQLYEKVGKEFCIAGSCSKVTDPDAWTANHCEWLEKVVVN